MIVISNKAKCTGCEACALKCPIKCIRFEADGEGFLYPCVDAEKCMHCGICEKVCPQMELPKELIPRHAYVSYSNNTEHRAKSTSGGLFTEIASQIIRVGGVVLGAGFKDDWTVEHDFTETIEGLDKFQGSKYVQSRTNQSYVLVQTYLRQGRKVLFSGTPCQIRGLKSFLGKDDILLTTVDVLCHGVPSPKVWKQYLSAIKTEFKGSQELRRVSFRDKEFGWRNYHLSLEFLDSNTGEIRRVSEVFYTNDYMRLFLNNIILRPSCYECNAKKGCSGSDITLGDCWGIKELLPQMDDDRGLSLVFANTAKGEALLSLVDINKHEVDVGKAINSNLAWAQIPPKHELRDLFFRKYFHQSDFHAIVNTLFHPPLGIRLIRAINRRLGISQFV